ncbi:MAG: hypothetical protein WC795_02025, partial [Candidatus Paceibacterota bacterium]
MKNTLKKIFTLGTVLSLVLMSAPAVFAAGAVFAVDCPNNNIAIANYTSGDGINSNGCWQKNVTTANTGDVINVRIFYHNGGDQPANNTIVKLTPNPTGMTARSSYSFTGSVGASNASTVSGNVAAYLPSALSLTYNSVIWKVNGNVQTLPGGQNGSEIFGSGLNLGTVAQGWNTQGSIVVAFTVGSTTSTQQKPTVTTMPETSVSQNSATFNGSVNGNGAPTSTWFEYGTSQSFGSITPQVNRGSGSTSFSATPSSPLTANTRYYFRAVAQNSAGITYSSVTENFITTSSGSTQQVPTITTLPASGIGQTTATFNGSVNGNGAPTSTWFEYGTTSSFGQTTPQVNRGSGQTSFTGVPSGPLSSNTTYYFRAVAQNSAGVVQSSVVESFITSSNQSAQCVINSFSANPSSVSSGGSSTLTWTTTNCSSASISSVGSVGTNSSINTGALYGTNTYTLTATGSSGTNQTSSVTVTVGQQQPNQCSINSFYANPSSVSSGGSSTLSWSTSNCTSANVSSIGSVSTNSSVNTGALYGTNTYTLTAYGQNTVTAQTTVTVSSVVNPTNQQPSVS